MCFPHTSCRTVRVWDAKSFEIIAVLEGHKDVVTSVCISSDSSKVQYTGARDTCNCVHSLVEFALAVGPQRTQTYYIF